MYCLCQKGPSRRWSQVSAREEIGHGQPTLAALADDLLQKVRDWKQFVEVLKVSVL